MAIQRHLAVPAAGTTYLSVFKHSQDESSAMFHCSSAAMELFYKAQDSFRRAGADLSQDTF